MTNHMWYAVMLHPWPTENIWLVFIGDHVRSPPKHTHIQSTIFIHRLVLLRVLSVPLQRTSSVGSEGKGQRWEWWWRWHTFGKVPTRGRRKTTGLFASATRDISCRGTAASQCLPCRWDTSYWSPATGQHKPDGRGACRVISWGKKTQNERLSPPFSHYEMKESANRASNYLTSSPSSSIERHIVHFSSVSSSSSSMPIFSSRGLLCGSHGQLLIKLNLHLINYRYTTVKY